MTTFVLVSGSWHASWCWERVVPLLEAAGHVVVAPDLLGMGANRTPLEGVTLAGWGDQTAEIIRAQREPVILVGHSRGGIVISETAERVADRVRQLVYLAAFLVPNGMSLMQVAASDQGTDFGKILEPGPPGSVVLKPEAVTDVFYNTTAPEWQARAIAHVSPEPVAAFSTALHLTEDYFGRVPRAYIECTRDNAIPLKLQRAMQTVLPCDPVVTLETDHSPFYSAPQALVQAFNAIASAS